MPGREDDPVKRRRFLASAAGVAFIPKPPPGAKPCTDPKYVHTLADRLVHTEEQIGGTPLVREAIRHIRHIAPAIERTEPRLQSAAARPARRSALVLHDTRRLDQAEQVAGLSQVVPLVSSRRVDIHVRHILAGTRRRGMVSEIRDARERLAEVTG